ncbi:MAG: T9SS type A sorting domain-containing protein [Ignavibacterium sp.]|nr:T9SS type A sorting domain-containing protein [Ignavibacterium sp.]
MCWQVFLGVYDLLAQRVDANGTVQWAQDGIYVCNAAGNQSLHQIVLDEDDNLFVGWQDSRNGSDLDVYIQRVNNDGTLGNPTNLEEIAFSLSDFNLFQNYPNPFNPTTNIQYQVSSNIQVLLKVYDVLGHEIATLVNEYKPAGSYEVDFDATGLSSGVYFYKLQTGSFVETKKMILMR